jgi:hypothetical protein
MLSVADLAAILLVAKVLNQNPVLHPIRRREVLGQSREQFRVPLERYTVLVFVHSVFSKRERACFQS